MLNSTFLAGALFALAASAGQAAPLTEGEATQLIYAEGRSIDDRKLDADRQPVKALMFMQVEAGDRVLDMFAGGGYYTEFLSHAVGENGRVIAQNPPAFARRPAISEAIEAKGLGSRLANVALMNVDMMDVDFAPASIDKALFHLVYHDLYFESAELGLPRTEPQAVLAAIHKGLAPGGTVTVIDHIGENPNTRAAVEATHRISPAVVVADFERAGFKLVGEDVFYENPADDRTKTVFDETIRGKTDRFALRFAKAADPNSAARVEGDDLAALTDADDGTCDATNVAGLAGQDMDDDIAEDARVASGAALVRISRRGEPVNDDLRSDRLDMVLSEDGTRILEISCQ
ncbi:MAG: I78 family peptidase inhibitor [Pseudomonadota bacterium]